MNKKNEKKVNQIDAIGFESESNINPTDSELNDIKASSEDFDDFDDPNSKYGGKKPDLKSKTPTIDSFSRDLTKEAEAGKIEPVIGRDVEISRVVRILSRRKKNNALILGESGCVDGDTLITVRKISDDKNHNIVIVDNA